MEVVEAVLVHLWEKALRRRPIGVDDNFFDQGGHSLVAIRIVHRVQAVFGVDVEYLTVLECGTVATLAKAIEERAAASGVRLADLAEAGRRYLSN